MVSIVTCSRLAVLVFGLISVELAAPLITLAAETKTSSEAEWAQTITAAKEEAKVGVFLYQRENIEAAVKVFEKKFPDIQVVTASTPAAETGPRLMAERRAGKFLWDVCLCGPTTPFAGLYPAKALDPIKPALLTPEVTDASKWWESKHQYMDPEGSHIFGRCWPYSLRADVA